MKRSISFVIVACLSLFAGCQTDDVNINTKGGKTTLEVSISDTRTHLGEESGGRYALYWSEGDCIAVNGAKLELEHIDADSGTKALFVSNSTLKYPYHITYPYAENSTAETPKVIFPVEQNYVEGSFDKHGAPMCGYAESGESVMMKHLSRVLRFEVRSEVEGVVLERVAISSRAGVKIAGEFVVDCIDATLSAGESSEATISYLLPDNFTLSSNSTQVLHILVPAVDAGECSVEFVEVGGARMVASWSAESVVAGKVHKFENITYKADATIELVPLQTKDDSLITGTDPNLVSGFLRDTNGEPIEGVAVSDGFSIVTTNSDGYYLLDVSPDCWYIYITIPAGYEVPMSKSGLPDFYQKYTRLQRTYNFTLKPLVGGAEEEFALFVIGDPQVGTQSGLNRLNDEAVPAIKAHAAEWQAKGIPCYGITLGDLISNNNSSDRSQWREPVRDAFLLSKVGMPVFHVMGNHDNAFFNSTNPIYADARSSTFELAIQRPHEEVYGPVNFSFDRGDMHIISMRNILYNRDNDCEGGLRRSFLKEQYEWLKQDLALVPKDKTVILCVHIPFQDGGGSYVDYTRNLINGYKEAHIMSGHSHIIQHIKGARAGYSNIYEHNMGALCGAWWTSYMCGDGSPAGYGVFLANGTTFTDWYHIGYDKTSKSRSHQMRLYKGNALTGKAKSGTDSNNTLGFYAFNFGENVLLANVYMADSAWKVEVYEDGEYSGEMTHLTGENKDYYARPNIYRDESTTPSTDGVGYGYMVGDGTEANPYRSTIPTSADIYFSGYTNGIRGFGDYKFGTNAQCYHMYYYELKETTTSVEVVATDRFGNEYRETKITDGTDYSLVQY